MAKQFLYLLQERRFLPLFLTQFLGAFNDNMFKNALILWIGFQAAHGLPLAASAMVALAAGVFILPFFLFSATAGELADKYDKAHIARFTKLAEIAIMMLGCAGFLVGSWLFLYIVLFAMGIHSTVFGPVKYALLPEHLKENELIQGNALIEGGTVLAILLGTIAGGVLILQNHGALLTGGAVIVVAALGYLASRPIPDAPPHDPALKFSLNIAAAIWELVRQTAERPAVFRAVIGISWFWLVGATFLSVLPAYVSDVLHAEPQLVTFLLATFSVGIAMGSIACYGLLKGKITADLAPWGALGMAAFGLGLVFASEAWQALALTHTVDITAFLREGAGVRIAAALFLIAFTGGVYVVPLYALMQARAEVGHRARVVAANNILNALFMVVSAAVLTGLFSRGVGLLSVLLGLAVLNAIAALWIHRIVLKHS